MPLARYSVPEWLAGPVAGRRLALNGLHDQTAAVRSICAQVAEGGDAALLELSRRYDGWAPEAASGFLVPPGDLEEAAERLGDAARSALQLAAERIRAFHACQVFGDVEGPAGSQLLTRPVGRAGLYVPGGRAAYPSTVLMTAIPARVAGVRSIALATPPGPGGVVPDAILAAARIAGVDEVYRIGGAQAIAAFAYGTESVPRADVIAGPGNIYVTLAKREVFGQVGVDAVAGPTEVLVVADRTARPDYVAADLASQLEHDPMAWAVLVTDSAALADAVEESFTELVDRLERSDVVKASRCCIVLASSISEAIAISNGFGPEHLELMAEDAEELLPLVENAGAVFMGPHAPVSLGDYVIGPNHTLPTSGSARFSSPLGVHTFLRRMSVSRASAADLLALQEAARTLARLEGLTAHAGAIEVRLEDARG
jgi:histidinol dehydrogenase